MVSPGISLTHSTYTLSETLHTDLGHKATDQNVNLFAVLVRAISAVLFFAHFHLNILQTLVVKPKRKLMYSEVIRDVI